MYIKQLTVFVENQKGRVADIAAAIGAAGIDIRAISVADTADFGILRLIVNDPYAACEVLREKEFMVSLTDVLAVGIPDIPGAFAGALKILAKNNIDVEYMYAFISRKHGEAFVILRVEDNDAAASLLREKGFDILSAEDVYK
ncbi:MAG: acetolactate synthase [Clostridia bacterium]|nr:acetolactate synthase [Clostridia bacterium]